MTTAQKPKDDAEPWTPPWSWPLRTELARMSASARAAAALLVVYVVGVSVARFWMCLDPWVAETDWKQWVWEYWRYSVRGAFPAGHPITDYTFNAQPPLYHAMMMVLSTLVRPVLAANLVNWFAWLAALVGVVLAVRARSNLLVGLMGAALFVRDDVVHRITAGGYPRSFGPTLMMLFLAAWLSGRHRLVLAVLLVEAALYPSVAVPCGLAYGLWTLGAAGWLPDRSFSLRRWLRDNVEVALTGVGVVVLGQMQSLTAPDWWGPVVWAKDAGPELTRAGRTAWLPLGDFKSKAVAYIDEPWNFSGVLGKYLPFDQVHAMEYGKAIVAALIVVVVVGRVLRWRGGAPRLSWPSFPLQLPLVLGAAVFSYWLAREFAFKLYLPHRMVQHTVPSIMFVAIMVVAYQAGKALFARGTRAEAKRTIAAFAVGMAPVFVLAGDGLGVGDGYRSYAANAPLYEWIQRHTKIGDQLGGVYRVLDETPLFTGRQFYVNWKMAHPFRKGFFDEIQRRTVKMYDAYFCTDLHDLLAFLDETDTQWFIVDRLGFAKLEGGDSQLFEPMRTVIDRTIYTPRKAQGFALADPPDAIVAFRHRQLTVVGREKLRAYLASRPAAPTTPAPAPAPAPAEPAAATPSTTPSDAPIE